MFLSVVVPTRNRRALLCEALESFAAQTYPNDRYEVIVVDNGSNDGTAAAVEAWAAAHRNVARIYEPRPGLHRCRHAGLAAARGDILVYADDDIRACPTWLEGIAESFGDPSVALVGGPVIPAFEAPPPPWIDRLWRRSPHGRYLSLYSIVDLGDRPISIPPQYVFGCNFSIRRSVLVESGGFHPDGMPPELLRLRGDGETAVSVSISDRGLKAFYNPKAAVHHWVSKERMTEEYVYRRSFAEGISDSYARARRARTPGIDAGTALRFAAGFLASRIRAMSGRNGHIELSRERGYRQGYRYHQAALAEDPALLEWVLKDDYLDD